MKSQTESPRRQPFVRLLIVAAAYVATARLGHQFAVPPGDVSPIWPPAGVALTALLLWGPRAAAGVWLGSFLAHAWALGASPDASLIRTLAVAGSIAVGATAQALLGAYLLPRWAGEDPLGRPAGVFRFLVVAALTGALGPSWGAPQLCAGGYLPWNNFGGVWFAWWLGATMGALVVVPLALSRAAPRLSAGGERRRAEVGLWVVALFAGGQAVFGPWSPAGTEHYSLAFLAVPLIVWAAVRFGRGWTALGVAALSAVALAGTVRGFGPFADLPRPQALLLVQAFTGVVAVTGLTLSASVGEGARARRELSRERDLLNLLMDNVPEHVFFKDVEGRYIRTNRARADFLALPGPERAVGKTDAELQPPEAAAGALSDERRVRETGT